LTFLNLKSDSIENKVGPQEKEKIWIPNLVFDNNPDEAYIENDALSSINVIMEGNPELNYNSELTIDEEFAGMFNPLIFSRSYEMKFGCDFVLHFYPFDTQHCFINVSKGALQIMTFW
jgi:hypothetical protein